MHRPTRGLTLVELAIVAFVGALVLIPFAIFVVQMVRASQHSSEKMLLSSDAHVASIALRAEILAGESMVVLSGVAPVSQGTLGDAIQVEVAGEIRIITLDPLTNRVVVQEGLVTRGLVNNVIEFSAVQTADSEVQIELKMTSRSDPTTSIRLQMRIPALNAIQE